MINAAEFVEEPKPDVMAYIQTKYSVMDRVYMRAAMEGVAAKKAGRPCDPQRFGARPGSAWDKWFREGYESAG